MIDWRVVQNNKRNVINFSVRTESLKHAMKKLEFCYFLKFLGIDFYTEARLNKHSRADIYIPSRDLAVEVLDSEKESNLEKKAKNYKCQVRGVSVLQELSLDFVEKVIG